MWPWAVQAAGAVQPCCQGSWQAVAAPHCCDGGAAAAAAAVDDSAESADGTAVPAAAAGLLLGLETAGVSLLHGCAPVAVRAAAVARELVAAASDLQHMP